MISDGQSTGFRRILGLTFFTGRTAEAVDRMESSGGLLVVRKPWPSMARTVYGDPERYQETYWNDVPGSYFTGDGARVDTFGPRGLSGGALLDLGEFTSPDSYARRPSRSALLSGIVIEYHGDHRALVAVKIGTIVDGIRSARATTSPGAQSDTPMVPRARI